MTFQFPTRSAFASDYERGVVLVATAMLAWSCSGIYARLLTTDIWTAIAWRSLFGGLFLLIPSFFLEGGFSRRQWASIFHPAGLAMLACQMISQACFIGALYMTTVANVTMIYATAPFIAAFLSWTMLKERVAKRTLIAGGVCLIGVAVIVASSIGGGTGVGDLLALGMTITFALIIVIPRMDRSIPILPSSVVGGLLTFARLRPLPFRVQAYACGRCGPHQFDGDRADPFLGLAFLLRDAARCHIHRRGDHLRDDRLAHGCRSATWAPCSCARRIGYSHQPSSRQR
jgi:uncharacterized membrane protein